MDRVFISGISATAIIGVYDRERDIKQRLVIDLELMCDTRAAGNSDDFNDALDYDAVTRLTIDHVERSSFQLIETVAESLAALLLDKFELPAVRIRVSKPGALINAENVGVMIERENQD